MSTGRVIDLRDGRPEPPVRTVIVEDEPLARAALAALMQRSPQIELVGEAGTVAEALAVVEAVKPEVVLSDLFLPDGDACVLALRLSQLGHRAKMVVATLFASPGAAAACSSAGAVTVLQKEAPPESLIAAVTAAARGERWYGAGAVRPLARHHLSYLESKVLAEVASGSTNEDIAVRLGYSANYIKDVLASARERLGARDRAHAAALSVALRLVRPGSDGRFTPSIPQVEEVPAVAASR